jgi:hypothetical protein
MKMPHHHRTYLAIAVSATLGVASIAWAAAPSTPDRQNASVQQKTAGRDLGNLSKDGANGFHDITLTRAAIFEGRTSDAKKYAGEANAAFDKAATDDTAFTKAEADMKAPKLNMGEPGKVNTATASDSGSSDQAKTPIEWLPVDGSIMIDEDYTADQTKSAAVADANKSLKKGDRKAAMDKLKLADMSIDVTLGVVPLRPTMASVQKAVGLIDDGKYYEASQVLKQAQDKERFDVTTVPGTKS